MKCLTEPFNVLFRMFSFKSDVRTTTVIASFFCFLFKYSELKNSCLSLTV